MIYLSMNLSKIFRYSFLAIFNALIVYAIPLTLTFESWFLLSLIVVIGILINVVYFSDRFLPMKWILPGMIFMISFVVFPAIYNSYVSFTNWSTGHILTKTQVIDVHAKIAQVVMTPVVHFRAMERQGDNDLYGWYPITISDRGDGALGSTGE